MKNTAEVIPIERNALSEYEITPAAVADMAKKYMTLTVPEGDTTAYREVRAALTMVVKTRTGTDKRRKELGADARAWIGEVNQAQKDLIAPLAPVEEHLRAELTAEDNRKAEIKAAEARKEAERIEAIREMVSSIQRLAMGLSGLTQDQIRDIMVQIDTLDVSPEIYFEFTAEANQAKTDAAIAAQQALDERVRLDQEEAARKAENERLEKVRKEQEAEAARLKAEQDKIDAARQAEERRQAAEQAKILKAQKEEQDRLDAERREIEEAHAKLEAEKKAEQDRKDREALEKKLAAEAKVKAEADAKEAAEREETMRLEAERAAVFEKERQESLKPDREKAVSWVQKLIVNTAAIPDLDDPEMREIIYDTVAGVTDILKDTIEAIEVL